MTVKQLAKVLRVDRRVILSECKSGRWGASKKRLSTGRVQYFISSPPTTTQTMVPRDVARIMGVSRRIVVEWCRTGRVKAYKVKSVWRIDYEDGLKLMFVRRAENENGCA